MKANKDLVYAQIFDDKECVVVMTEEGKKCNFLQFLHNTSNFTWKEEKADKTIKSDLLRINDRHLLSKLCAIGYLLQPIKDKLTRRAVIAVDKCSAEGGTGKSLFGQILRQAIASSVMSGRHKLFEDNFRWHPVTEETKLVCIEDLPESDFTYLLDNITGSWTIHSPMKKSFNIHYPKSPRIFITSKSKYKYKEEDYTCCSWYLYFSDYYGRHHSPEQDFGLMVEQWDDTQWILFNRLLIECMKLYTEFGYIEA